MIVFTEEEKRETRRMHAELVAAMTAKITRRPPRSGKGKPLAQPSVTPSARVTGGLLRQTASVPASWA